MMSVWGALLGIVVWGWDSLSGWGQVWGSLRGVLLFAWHVPSQLPRGDLSRAGFGVSMSVALRKARERIPTTWFFLPPAGSSTPLSLAISRSFCVGSSSHPAGGGERRGGVGSPGCTAAASAGFPPPCCSWGCRWCCSWCCCWWCWWWCWCCWGFCRCCSRPCCCCCCCICSCCHCCASISCSIGCSRLTTSSTRFSAGGVGGGGSASIRPCSCFIFSSISPASFTLSSHCFSTSSDSSSNRSSSWRRAAALSLPVSAHRTPTPACAAVRAAFRGGGAATSSPRGRTLSSSFGVFAVGHCSCLCPLPLQRWHTISPPPRPPPPRLPRPPSPIPSPFPLAPP
eukprot:Hpha_TRINITY_DN16434_c1_g1::TRINITY_DN16434_c1_g1_i3::g.162347::m.162347